MRRSELFAETLRQVPADAEIVGHQLLLRGAYIQPFASGIYSFLPLGQRVNRLGFLHFGQLRHIGDDIGVRHLQSIFEMLDV